MARDTTKTPVQHRPGILHSHRNCLTVCFHDRCASFLCYSRLAFVFSCHDYSICIRDCQGRFANLPPFAIWKFRQIRGLFFVTVAQSVRYGVQNTHSAFVCPAIGSLYRTPVYRCKITRSIFTPQRKAPKYRIFRSLFVYWVYSAYRTNSSVWYSRITRLSGVTPSRKR